MSVEKAVREVENLIDEVTSPKRMSKTEYRDFLEELGSSIDGRLDAVKEELRDEEG